MSEKIRVLSYSNLDEKVFSYKFDEREIQGIAATFNDDIFFTVTDEELFEYISGDVEIIDNLKEDFIWFRPGVNQRHIMQCTCGQFLESGHNMDKLAKLGLKHHRRTGHSINLRGN